MSFELSWDSEADWLCLLIVLDYVERLLYKSLWMSRYRYAPGSSGWHKTATDSHWDSDLDFDLPTYLILTTPALLWPCVGDYCPAERLDLVLELYHTWDFEKSIFISSHRKKQIFTGSLSCFHTTLLSSQTPKQSSITQNSWNICLVHLHSLPL